MTDIDHMLEVLQAAKAGKTIQSKPRTGPTRKWGTPDHSRFDWINFDYRVKPAGPRRIWLNWYPTMNCRSLYYYDSRAEAKSFARHEVSEQIEFVEVVK